MNQLSILSVFVIQIFFAKQCSELRHFLFLLVFCPFGLFSTTRFSFLQQQLQDNHATVLRAISILRDFIIVMEGFGKFRLFSFAVVLTSLKLLDFLPNHKLK
jgi:hypothetical protein